MRGYEITSLVGDGWSLVKEFDVLHHGWDCDGTGYLVKNKNDKLVLLLSSHGSFYVAERGELDEYIDDYVRVLRDTREVLELLKTHNE